MDCKICFKLVSSLKINVQKSELIHIEEVKEVVGCKVGILPASYLSLPLGSSHRYCTLWAMVEKRFTKRLASWKKQYMSKGGRLVLIKSTPSSFPTHFMSNFAILRKVRIRLEENLERFLVGNHLERKKDASNELVDCLQR